MLSHALEEDINREFIKQVLMFYYLKTRRCVNTVSMISVGRYTENTEYRGIEINTASFLQISKYRDRNYWVNLYSYLQSKCICGHLLMTCERDFA